MKAFIGTKLINAKPMTRAEYNTFRGWELPANENGADEGFLVEYVGVGQNPNTSEYSGYVSWSPKEVFEEAYRPTTKLDFGGALDGHVAQLVERWEAVAGSSPAMAHTIRT